MNIKVKYYKGYQVTIEKSKSGLLTLRNKDFKFRYLYYTENDAIKNFVQILKTI